MSAQELESLDTSRAHLLTISIESLRLQDRRLPLELPRQASQPPGCHHQRAVPATSAYGSWCSQVCGQGTAGAIAAGTDAQPVFWLQAARCAKSGAAVHAGAGATAASATSGARAIAASGRAQPVWRL